MDHLEEHLAHLQRAVDELSDVVARQETTISMLNRRVQLLMNCETERDALAGNHVVLADKQPPHW